MYVFEIFLLQEAYLIRNVLLMWQMPRFGFKQQHYPANVHFLGEQWKYQFSIDKGEWSITKETNGYWLCNPRQRACTLFFKFTVASPG